MKVGVKEMMMMMMMRKDNNDGEEEEDKRSITKDKMMYVGRWIVIY